MNKTEMGAGDRILAGKHDMNGATVVAVTLEHAWLRYKNGTFDTRKKIAFGDPKPIRFPYPHALWTYSVLSEALDAKPLFAGGDFAAGKDFYFGLFTSDPSDKIRGATADAIIVDESTWTKTLGQDYARSLRVGDRVLYPEWVVGGRGVQKCDRPGEIIAIEGGEAWIRRDIPLPRPVDPLVHASRRLADLKLLPRASEKLEPVIVPLRSPVKGEYLRLCVPRGPAVDKALAGLLIGSGDPNSRRRRVSWAARGSEGTGTMYGYVHAETDEHLFIERDRMPPGRFTTLGKNMVKDARKAIWFAGSDVCPPHDVRSWVELTPETRTALTKAGLL